MNTQNTFKMRLLPSRPDDITVFFKGRTPDKTALEPFLVGDGVLDFNCGNCGLSLLHLLRPRQLTQAVYKCPKCGEYNQIELPLKRN